MDFGGRRELFRALVGSHNYNINTLDSDKDYKAFILPTFDDLYKGEIFSKSYESDTIDVSCHDIRHLVHLLWKSNINFLEVLFSIELQVNNSLDGESKYMLYTILNNKEAIARMNLPYLYNACIGMFITKRKGLYKENSKNKHLIDKYGYDTKSAMTCIRVIDCLDRYKLNNFTDFGNAIRYSDIDTMRLRLLKIKNGDVHKEDIDCILDSYFNIAETKLKPVYMSMEPNLETKMHLEKIIKSLIKKELA